MVFQPADGVKAKGWKVYEYARDPEFYWGDGTPEYRVTLDYLSLQTLLDTGNRRKIQEAVRWARRELKRVDGLNVVPIRPSRYCSADGWIVLNYVPHLSTLPRRERERVRSARNRKWCYRIGLGSEPVDSYGSEEEINEFVHFFNNEVSLPYKMACDALLNYPEWLEAKEKFSSRGRDYLSARHFLEFIPAAIHYGTTPQELMDWARNGQDLVKRCLCHESPSCDVTE